MDTVILSGELGYGLISDYGCRFAVSKPCGEKMIRKLKTYEAGKQLFAQLSAKWTQM